MLTTSENVDNELSYHAEPSTSGLGNSTLSILGQILGGLQRGEVDAMFGRFIENEKRIYD